MVLIDMLLETGANPYLENTGTQPKSVSDSGTGRFDEGQSFGDGCEHVFYCRA